MSTLVITNPAAGPHSRRAAAAQALDALGRRAGVVVARSERPGHAAEIARARGADVERVFVCGGDGTVGEVAAALAGTDVPIGIVPVGTTNVLASECGLPSNPAKAASLLLDGGPTTRTFQLWRAAGREFVLGLGVGYDARLMRHSGAGVKARGGMLSLYGAAFRELLRYDFPRLMVSGVDDEGELFEVESSYALVCNTKRYAGSFPTAPAADPADGVLDLVLFQGRSKLALWLFWAAMMSRGALHLDLPFVKQKRACRCSVRSLDGAQVEVQMNGDYTGTTPVSVEAGDRVRFFVGGAVG